jgi:hypothetical protein
MRVLVIFLLSGVMTVTIITARSLLKAAEKRTSSIEERLDNVELDLEDLRGRVATIRGTVPGRSACLPGLERALAPKAPEAVEKSPPKENPKTPERRFTPEEQAAAAERDVQKLRDSIESNFAAQPVDRKWGDSIAADVRAKVGAALREGSELRSIECRASICRLETSHPDEATYQAFVSKSLSSPEFNWQGAMAFAPLRTESSGEVTWVAYLMRPGYALPYPDAPN